MGVVYFDQCLGVARYTQVKYAFLSLLHEKNKKEKKGRSDKMRQRKGFLGLHPNAGGVFYIGTPSFCLSV